MNNLAAPRNLKIIDELARAVSFIEAAHMAATALADNRERDALQEVLDEAGDRVREAKRLATEMRDGAKAQGVG